MLVFKSAPTLLFTGLTKQIGVPRDLEKNLEEPSYFEKADIDTSIPLSETKELKAKPQVDPKPAVENPEVMQQRISNVLGNVNEVHYTPIKSLNNFNHDWRIKARVTKKHDMRTWKNAKSEGFVFNIELMDSQGTQIQATFFNESAEKYERELVEGGVYLFSGGIVQMANTKYSSIKNDFTIKFDKNSVIEPAADDNKIKANGFSFVKIDEINDIEQARTVDVAGVIINVGPVSVFQPKSYDGGAPRPSKDRRTLQLADESGL